MCLCALPSLAFGDVFLFGDVRKSWHLVDDQGKVERSFRQLGGVSPLDAAVSRDGRRWAVVEPGVPPNLLLLNGPEARPARRVRARGNVLDGVAFSNDGEWVYFSSNDWDQPRFENQTMVYAQVYRVEFESGLVERLTLEKGCHVWPRPTATGFVNAHSTCRGGSSLEVIAKGAATRVLVPNNRTVGEIATDETGARVFYFYPTPRGFDLMVARDGQDAEKWGEVEAWYGRHRPQWVDPDAILFQLGNSLFRLRKEKLERVTELEGG